MPLPADHPPCPLRPSRRQWLASTAAALPIGSVAVGSTQHLAATLFETRAGIEALVVP